MSGIRDERSVLDDQRDLVCRDGATREESLLRGIGDQVTGSFTGIHVQAGDAPGVVVVEQQAGALLVGVVERLAAVVIGFASQFHVGHVRHTDALRPVGHLARRRDPLVGGAV